MGMVTDGVHSPLSPEELVRISEAVWVNGRITS
jgi:hypothetical protein